MQYSIYPICYHDTLSESEMEQRECGDGIYVSVEEFTALAADSDEMVLYRMSRGAREAYVHVCGVHHGERYAVMAPAWICGVLDSFGDEATVRLERAYLGIGSRIKIRPHSTDYALADDPVEVLQRAFEPYSSIMPGVEIPLMADGRLLIVSVLETNGGPICIRGVELEVVIETAEATAAAATAAAEAVTAPVPASADANLFDFNAPMVPSLGVGDGPQLNAQSRDFPGCGHRLGNYKS